MKKLSADQTAQYENRILEGLRRLRVKEGLQFTTNEWPGKSAPYGSVSNLGKRNKKKYRVHAIKNGFVVIRIK